MIPVSRRGWLLVAATLLLPLAALAQQKSEYTSTCSGNLADASTACTIQAPAGTSLHTVIRSVFVQCSVQCTISQERDGTAATVSGASVAATIRKVNPNAAWVPASVSSVFKASNVGAGTPIGPEGGIVQSASPAYLVLEGGSIVLERDAAGVRNYTIKPTAGSGTYVVTFLYEQRASL